MVGLVGLHHAHRAVGADARAAAVPAAGGGEPVGLLADAVQPVRGPGVHDGVGAAVGEAYRRGQIEAGAVEHDAGVPGIREHPRRPFHGRVRAAAGQPRPADFSQAWATSSGSLFCDCTWVARSSRVFVSSLAETASSASTPLWDRALL